MFLKQHPPCHLVGVQPISLLPPRSRRMGNKKMKWLSEDGAGMNRECLAASGAWLFNLLA